MLYRIISYNGSDAELLLNNIIEIFIARYSRILMGRNEEQQRGKCNAGEGGLKTEERHGFGESVPNNVIRFR